MDICDDLIVFVGIRVPIIGVVADFMGKAAEAGIKNIEQNATVFCPAIKGSVPNGT